MASIDEAEEMIMASPNEAEEKIMASMNEDEKQRERILSIFEDCREKLDKKNDLREKIIKKSRDVTIESKRIIFHLHRSASADEEKKAKILNEARDRLRNVYNMITYGIGGLLVSESVWQYEQAYSPGMQEFVEAASFYYYLACKNMLLMEHINDGEFLFGGNSDSKAVEEIAHDKKACVDEKSEAVVEVADEKRTCVDEQTTPADAKEKNFKKQKKPNLDENEKSTAKREMVDLLSKEDYLLGIADLTGELMRKCVSSGSIEEPFELRAVLKSITEAFYVLHNDYDRKLTRKYNTLKASLRKVDRVCYLIQVRGLEKQRLMADKGMSTVTELFESLTGNPDASEDYE